jgi:hypothetical protein
VWTFGTPIRYPTAPALFSSLIDVVLSEPAESCTRTLAQHDLDDLVRYHFFGHYNVFVTDEEWEAVWVGAKPAKVPRYVDVDRWSWPPGKGWIGRFFRKVVSGEERLCDLVVHGLEAERTEEY